MADINPLASASVSRRRHLAGLANSSRKMHVLRLSILIPVLGKLDLLEQTLVSVLENRPDRTEILVVVNDQYDDPYHLEGEVRFVAAPHGAGLADCVNSGVAAARAPIVHLLGCGTTVHEGWAELPLGHFRDPHVGAVAPLVLRRWSREAEPRVVSAGLDYQAAGIRVCRGAGRLANGQYDAATPVLGPSASAAFYRKACLDELFTCFDAQLGDRLADVDLALRLRRAGHLAVCEPRSRVEVHAASSSHSSPLAESRFAERLFWRHLDRSRAWGTKLMHFLTIVGESATGLPFPRALTQPIGRMLGWLERHRMTLESDWHEPAATAEVADQDSVPAADLAARHGTQLRVDGAHAHTTPRAVPVSRQNIQLRAG